MIPSWSWPTFWGFWNNLNFLKFYLKFNLKLWFWNFKNWNQWVFFKIKYPPNIRPNSISHCNLKLTPHRKFCVQDHILWPLERPLALGCNYMHGKCLKCSTLAQNLDLDLLCHFQPSSNIAISLTSQESNDKSMYTMNLLESCALTRILKRPQS
jgi:hypothetical protein